MSCAAKFSRRAHVGFALRHEHEPFAVAARYRDGLVLGLCRGSIRAGWATRPRGRITVKVA